MHFNLDIQYAVTTVSHPIDSQFQAWAEAVPGANSVPYLLTIRIVDEPEARLLNRQYRNKDYATNVLSFPADLPAGLPEEVRQTQLGDLLICAPVVAREATEQKRSETDHWAHLTIHGILHLLGYDHQQVDEADKMESLETEILAKFGISDPYQDLG